MSQKNSAKKLLLCQSLLITIILIQKAFNFVIAYLFLFDIKFGLYPYSDIQDSFSSNVISSNAVFFKICFSLIAIFLSFCSSFPTQNFD